MKIKELIEYLKKLDQESNIFLQYDSSMWYDLKPEHIERPNADDLNFKEAKKLGVKETDYKIEMG